VVDEVAEVVPLYSHSTAGLMGFVCMLALIVVRQQPDINPQQWSPIVWVEAIAIAQQQPDSVGAKLRLTKIKLVQTN